MESSSAGDTEVAVQSSPSGVNTFEAFVKNAIQKIQREAWGRSSEVVEIRNACQTFLGNPQNENTHPHEALLADYLSNGQNRATSDFPFKEESTRAALEPLKLACACSIARIVEPALGCLHKMVAYAWVQGESSSTGNMDDGTLVSEIVSVVVKCIQLGNSAVYLAVIQALLTFATAEHFIAHGHCLLHMVRTVFNLAVSCDETNLKRTACNALLQMLNTIVKRVIVTQFQLTSHHSMTRTLTADSSHEPAPAGQSMQDSNETTHNLEPPQAKSGKTEDTGAGEALGTWKLADLAEKEDIEALEAAFENKQRDMEEPMSPISTQAEDGPSTAITVPDVAAPDLDSDQIQAQVLTPKRAKRPRGWDQLTVLEKDVLVVLMAFCKLAGVNTTLTTAEAYVRHGKLLALELLVKVFENSGHRWENVRLEFCEQLRFPLCLVLIRNCSPSEVKGFQFAIRLFVSVIMQRQIRLGLKSELGALYPLLLLRPLEAESLDPSVLTVTLAAIKRISKEPQMQVDMFINYDCNLKAPNLYERTAKALSQLAFYGDPNATPNQSLIVREAAATCSMAMLASLDAWAGPVKDAANVGHAINGEGGNVSEPSANGNGTVMGTTSEVHHFGAAKEKKNSFSIGVELFNKSSSKGIASLVASGVVVNKPDAIASFLRKNKEELDDSMLGEYLGLHDEMPIKVMHAYIDMEKYEGLTVDAALRKLLAQFRLPGEAQKIDRIMEKFAERYCQDNSGIFHSADDAYVLAFALIMLNTDLHNPMADKRLTKQDFQSMNQRQEADGSFVDVLPAQELEAMFDRIAANEIKTANTRIGLTKQVEALALHRNLASAVGLTQLALPFRSGRVWDKIRGAQIEHEHLLALTQKAMRTGPVDADLWFTATHTEHSRPMLEVAGPFFQKALAAAIESAMDRESAEKSVNSLVMAIHLTALLGLDQLCQQFVSTLCKSIGVHNKEVLIRTNPARQICALRALIGVASDDQAGLLGSSWPLILRTISSVEALISDMRRSHKSNQSVFEESMQALKFQSFDRKDHDRSSAIGRFFNQIGLSKMDPDVYSSVSPGQAIRIWSDGEGVTELDRIFVKSASLDGDAVVSFCKALCQVSREELTPGISQLESMAPRVFSLRKLVECAYYNLGRIRLIWGRLWSTIASHLVNSSCHSDQTVAMYSVDSLRQLVGKLLSRDELVNFTTQSDTLRPFVAVLKQCANVVVRELAVQCIEQAMNAHSSRLGSGWIIILEFLSVASLDPAPSVTRQCLDTLQSVIDIHWRKWGRGRDALADCVNVALRVARNPYNLDCSLKAIQLMKRSADELVMELGASGQIESLRSVSVDYHHEEIDSQLQRTSSVPASSTNQQNVQKKEQVVVVEPLLSRSSLWTVIFESLVEIITREERRKCADLAAEILFSFLKHEFLATWDRATWDAFFSIALVKVFDQRESAYSMDSGLDRILSYSTSFIPVVWETIASNYDKNGKLLLAHILDILIGWMDSSRQAVALSGVYLFQDLIDGVAEKLDDEGWNVIIENLKFAWTVCVDSQGKASQYTSVSNPKAAIDVKIAPFKSWIWGRDLPLSMETIQIRSQCLISLQRIMHRVHSQHGALLSEEMFASLTETLVKVASDVAEADKDPKFKAALSEYILDPDYKFRQPSIRRNQIPDISEIQTEENDGIRMEQVENSRMVKLPSLRVDPAQSPSSGPTVSPMDSLPELFETVQYQKQNSLFCGFLKLQVEGGMLTIQALKSQALQKGKHEHLYSFCRELISQASAEIKAKVKDGSDNALDSCWEQGLKAQLVSRALDVYKDVEGEVLISELKLLAPQLATLICSRELAIRQSVSNLLKTKAYAILTSTL